MSAGAASLASLTGRAVMGWRWVWPWVVHTRALGAYWWRGRNWWAAPARWWRNLQSFKTGSFFGHPVPPPAGDYFDLRLWWHEGAGDDQEAACHRPVP